MDRGDRPPLGEFRTNLRPSRFDILQQGGIAPVPDPEQQDLRSQRQRTPQMEVVVLGDDHPLLRLRKAPDFAVHRAAAQPVAHVNDVVSALGKPGQQNVRQIFVDDELQYAGLPSIGSAAGLESIWDAYSHAARMSWRVSEG